MGCSKQEYWCGGAISFSDKTLNSAKKKNKKPNLQIKDICILYAEENRNV